MERVARARAGSTVTPSASPALLSILFLTWSPASTRYGRTGMTGGAARSSPPPPVHVGAVAPTARRHQARSVRRARRVQLLHPDQQPPRQEAAVHGPRPGGLGGRAELDVHPIDGGGGGLTAAPARPEPAHVPAPGQLAEHQRPVRRREAESRHPASGRVVRVWGGGGRHASGRGYARDVRRAEAGAAACVRGQPAKAATTGAGAARQLVGQGVRGRGRRGRDSPAGLGGVAEVGGGAAG